MSSAHILSTFQSTFPGLYQAPKKSEDEPPPDVPGPEPEPVTQQDDEPDQYSTRIAGITSKFEKMRASADEMEQYLRSAAEDAKEAEARALAKADEDFTPAWRNVGLPLKPSHLHLDHGAMAGARLVNPKAIVQEYQAIKGREVLNPPRIAEYADTSAKPNYLKTTHAMEERKTRTISPDRTARIQALSARHLTWHTLTPEEVAAKMEEAEQRRRQLGLKMPRAQFELEQKIIQSMHHKLTFLRNPRHPLPPAVKNLMELRPDEHRWVGPRATVLEGVKPPIKADMTAHPEQVFVVEPAEVTFTNYAVGRTYDQVVRVRNVTAVSRSLRIFPPASQYFHASLPRFPGEVGVLAPGMAAEVTVRFCPDSLGDYEDAIAVDATHSRQTVPLRARRPPPSLTLPEEIDMGQVVIGNVKTEQVVFKNMGGAGRFRIVPEADWPEFAADAPTDRAVVGQFKIWPLYFEMAAGEELGLNVSYEPTEWGNTEERLVLVCDNCQVKMFSLVGNAVGVDVLLHSVDGRMLEPRELDLPLWFGECAPGSGFSKTVSVRNTTKLPFAFEWGLTKFPQVQNRRRANEPLQTEAQYDEEQDDEGHVLLVDNKSLRGTSPLRLGTGGGAAAAPPAVGGGGGGVSSSAAGVNGSVAQGPGAGTGAKPPGPMKALAGAENAGTPWGVNCGNEAHGPDPLALGAVVEDLFRVVPRSGVLQPGEVMEFLFTFTPPGQARYERWAQLRVDRKPIAVPSGSSPMVRGSGSGTGRSHAAIAASATCDVLVAEVGLEGLGCPVQLSAAPRLVSLPGKLMPAEGTTRHVTLRNPTRAQVAVRATVDNPAISVSPAHFLMPSLGSLSLAVTVRAPPDAAPGPLSGRVVLEVEHGPPVPIEVRAAVGSSYARLMTPRINFGDVPLSGSSEQRLVIRNMSATCPTPWSIRELTPALVAAEKSRLLRAQLMQSSRMLDPQAAAAALDALAEEEAEEAEAAAAAEEAVGASATGHHARFAESARSPAASTSGAVAPSAAERRALFAAGRHTGSSLAKALPPPDTTHVSFEPSSGVLEPNQELTVRVTCQALTDGRHRSIIQLRSGTPHAGGGLDGGLHMECLEAFACVVTPACVVDRPVLDLGVTFVGVQVRQTLYLTNLSQLPVSYRWTAEAEDEGSQTVGLAELKIKPDHGELDPGEDVEIQVRYTPRYPGPCVMYGVCELEGAPQPLGFRVSSAIHGLDVTYDLLTQEQYDDYVARDQTAAALGSTGPRGAAAMAVAAVAAGGANTGSGGYYDSESGEVGGGDGGGGPSPAEEIAAALEKVNFMRMGRHGKPEVDVEAFSGLTHLPPEVLTRVASHRHASTSAAGSKAASRRASARPGAAAAAARPRSGAAGVAGAGGLAATWPPPTPQRHLVADFGHNVPLGETRQMYLVVTNRTAMHTSIRTWLERFGVADASRFVRGTESGAVPPGGGAAGADKTASGGAEGGAGKGGASRRTTKDDDAHHHQGPKLSRYSKYTPIKLAGTDAEKRAPFRADKGNEMMATRRLQEEADEALGNKGLAVSVTPPESTLEPWSRLVLVVSCFNDMCGAYMDMMHVKVGDLPARDIPVLVGVSGTPLVVQRERVLVRGLRERSWRTGLEWGQVPQGVEQSRTFYVFNTGSLDMHLAWEARRYHDYLDLDKLPPTTDVGAGGTGQHDSLWGGAPGTLRDTRAGMKLFDVTLQPDERAGSVRVATERHADPTEDVPFRVEPAEQVIKGNTSAKFTVTFCASESRRHGGYLHGTQRVFSPESPLELRVWTAGENADRVGALLSGTFHPYAGAPPTPLQPLRVDLGAQAQACRLEPDGQADLAWVVTSIQQPGSHPAFVHSVTLSNTAHCPQVFSLDVEGPWDMVAATPSVPQDPVAYRGTSTLLGPAAASGRLGTSAADGGLTFLPPGESVDVTLRFSPGKGDMEALPVRFAAMQAKQRVIETVNDYKNTGALSITFANGDSQSLPLVAEMLHPRLEVKPRKLDFKKVHLQSPKEMFVMLANPTNVDAAWAVTVEGHKPRFPTLPGAGAAASAAAAKEAKEEAAAAAAAAGGGSASAQPTPRSASGGNLAGEASAADSRAASAVSGASRPATMDGGGAAAAAAPAGGVPPPPKLPGAAGPGTLAGVTGIIAEARIGPYIVKPASGVLPGRGLGMPRSQRVSITFAPTEAEAYEGELIFAVLRGKQCSVDVDGEGSIEETDETKGHLFVI